MPVNSSDFLDFAQQSAALKTEIGDRNAISRAYYAVFHEALALADTHFPDPNAHLAMGDHERLSERYKQWDKLPSYRSFAIMLVNMKSQRHLADYDLHETVINSQALTQLQTANRFLARLTESCSQLVGSPTIPAQSS